jgi:hypothetical protein
MSAKYALLISTAISGTLGFGIFASAVAADIDVQHNAAVSAPNGKIEIYGGDAGLNGFNSSML